MTKDEFEVVMKSIDAALSLKGVPIHARSTHAGCQISRSYGIDFIVAPAPFPSIKGRYDSLTMCSHVQKWYKDRYGDRVNIPFDDRRVVIVIKNELWCLTLPIVFGHFTAVCDPDLEKYKGSPSITIDSTPVFINVLNCIKHMTEETGKSLSEEDQRDILKFFVHSLDLIQGIWDVKDKPYIKEAIADFQSSVNLLIGQPPHYGQSKWASLQMVEKFIKSYLRIKTIPFPKNHNLEGLAALAVTHGLNAIDSHVLHQVACGAGVRYGEVPVLRDEAVKAHHASICICTALLTQIKKA